MYALLPRRLAAVLLVLALTGSALAVTQQRLYRGSADGDAEASGVVAVQQHTVFVEIVVEEERNETEGQVHEFAAVVGLIKKCERIEQRNAFDNAVLWFNDQFLFGEKNNQTVARNITPDSALGNNSKDNNLMQRNGETGRWGGCYIPNGFAFAIGADDPYGTGHQFDNETVNSTTSNHGAIPDDNMDLVKELIALDNTCQGCIFEYQSSFFITDPNYPNSPQSVRWIVDKLVYPVSVLGNLFQEGEDNPFGRNDCSSGNGLAPFSDPRDRYPHQDTCEDQGDDRENHDCQSPPCHPPENRARESGPEEANNHTLMEPLYTVHLQVDPLSQGPRGFLDKASWQYKDGTVVSGMPYSQDEDDEAFTDCKREIVEPYECSIEYNFLLAVDFAAFDDAREPQGENEIQEGSVHHGEGELPQDKAWQGNSHPHNPQAIDEGPNHQHDALSLDIFFNERAPFFVMEHPYWDEHGGPPAVNPSCSDVSSVSGATEEQREAVQARSPIVCDVDQDSGEFHKHDGSETIRTRDDDPFS